MHPDVRVLFLNQTYRPDPVATSQYLARWAEQLAREGHEVTVVACRRSYHNPQIKHPASETCAGVRIERVDGGGGAGSGRMVGFARFLIAALLRAMVSPKQDVIIALSSPPLLSVVAALVARVRGVRWVAWVMDIHPDAAIAANLLDPKSITARVARKLSRWSLRRADQVVTLDRYMGQRLIDLGVEPRRIEIIPLWMQGDITFDLVGRDAVRWTRGWDDKFVVMCAGNHGACHPSDTLRAVVEELRDEASILFCWVGGGSQWPELHLLAGKRVTLVDYVPHGELAALLSAADLHVVTMGEPFVGLLHPCKVYNILAAHRPFLYVGPPEGPVADVVREMTRDTQLGEVAVAFRPGESAAMAAEIRSRAWVMPVPWPLEEETSPWSEAAILQKMTSTLSQAGRFTSGANEMSPQPGSRPLPGRPAVSDEGGDGAGGRRRGAGALRRR
jgi:colanic acid biosynthesis glycosyl transferase WcaI